MNQFFFVAVVAFALVLMGLLLWTFRSSGRSHRKSAGLAVLDSAPQHLCNMGPIRRSQDAADLRHVADQGGDDLARRLKRERRGVALLYLNALRSDFEQLLRIARVVALLSPELSSSYEYERLRLSLLFRIRFQMVRIRLQFGDASMSQLVSLGEMVTSLAIRMESAMEELGERAALAANFALQSDQ